MDLKNKLKRTCINITNNKKYLKKIKKLEATKSSDNDDESEESKNEMKMKATKVQVVNIQVMINFGEWK